MRKLAGLILLAMLVAFQTNAQEQKKELKKKAPLTAEQNATLTSKKMALALDLSEAQQKQVYQMMLKQAEIRKTKMAEFKKAREEGKELTQDQRFQMQKDRLDAQIAHKAEMKKILSEEQYQKWQKTSKQRVQKGKERMQKARKMREMKERKAKMGERRQVQRKRN